MVGSLSAMASRSARAISSMVEPVMRFSMPAAFSISMWSTAIFAVSVPLAPSTEMSARAPITSTAASMSTSPERFMAPRSLTVGAPWKRTSASRRTRWNLSASVSKGSSARIRSRSRASSMATAMSSIGNTGSPRSKRPTDSRRPSTSRSRTTFLARSSPPPS